MLTIMSASAITVRIHQGKPGLGSSAIV
jgi:hypothetical protein